MRIGYVLLALPLILSCGQRQAAMSVTEAPAETVCTIDTDGPDGMLGALNSLAVIDGDRLALCTETQVFLYDTRGRQLCRIGNSGRARFEYLMPYYVRTDGDRLYVWDAMTPKIIVYTFDGQPVEEYVYDSGINDFLPCGDRLVVSAGGLREDRLVEIYDLTSGAVVNSFGEASYAHRSLKWMTVSPIAVQGDRVYFMSKDRLDLMSCDMDGNVPEVEASIESDTFKVEPLEAKLGSREREQYLADNSYVVSLFGRKGAWYVLTSEGRYSVDDNHRMDPSDRYLSLYRISGGKGRKLSIFTVDSFGASNLLSVCGGELYFIHHDITADEDVYTLKKLTAGR